jgi:putative Mg2+ transporter-C (MgtC) family protein
MIYSEVIIKLLLAIIVGGLIGAEREFRHRAAGLRTIILICLGSTLFTMFSLELGGEVSPVRIAGHMVSGVGFLCAGVIMEAEERIVGLTTASVIWFTAAMGMGIGGGLYWVVLFSLVGATIVLWVFPKFEKLIYNVRERRTYEMVCDIHPDRIGELEVLFRDCELEVRGHKLGKQDEEMVCTIHAHGGPEQHERLIQRLMDEGDITTFHY